MSTRSTTASAFAAILAALLAAPIAAQEYPVAWDGESTAPLALGNGERRPEVLEHGLRFRATDGTVATFPPDVLPVVEGPLTVEVRVEMSGYPREKAGILGRWQLVDGGRSFELGVFENGHLFFTASASGRWPERAREIRSPAPVPTGRPVKVGFAFVPGRLMSLWVDGEVVRATALGVPERLFPADIPIHVGCRAGGTRHAFEGVVSGVWIAERASGDAPPVPSPPYDLDAVRAATRRWDETLRVEGEPYGAYALRPGQPPDLYASADLAWIRWMCDDLDVTGDQRAEWLGFIASCQRDDGGYRHGTGHCDTHAFCHATGAVKMLGEDHRKAPALLEPYRDVAGIPAWLDAIDWSRPWGASHDIWGAGLPIACSPKTPDAWRDAFFGWLDAEVDPATGYWRKGVRTRTRLELLGGAFHIWPIYAAMDRTLPFPERIIDSVLSLQQPDGSFDGGFGYGHMDGVWTLAHLMPRHAHRRDDVRAALERATAGLMERFRYEQDRFFTDAHSTLSRIASLAIVYEVLPALFESDHAWRNPWSRRELFAISFAARK